VGHLVALSVVGTDRLAESGYMRAKLAQEKLIKSSPVPFSIVHATQFFEFVRSIADAATEGDTVHIPPVLFQPMAADDVAAGVARVTVGAPLNNVVEIAGPEQLRFHELVRQALRAFGDPRPVVADPDARYFGAHLRERTLVAGDYAELGGTHFADWLARTTGGK
jgi:uncharacterized protein YbjT (DUF2867 family)